MSDRRCGTARSRRRSRRATVRGGRGARPTHVRSEGGAARTTPEAPRRRAAGDTRSSGTRPAPKRCRAMSIVDRNSEPSSYSAPSSRHSSSSRIGPSGAMPTSSRPAKTASQSRSSTRCSIAHPAASSSSSVAFASNPPRYPPMLPSDRTTRWQGTTIGRGLVAHAVPTARAALGRPASSATFA